MINVNDKLIREELPHIGSDALTVLFVISSHLGIHQTAWPGIDRIRKMVKVEVNGEMRKMSTKRVYAALKRLENRNLITRNQVKGEGGVFSHTVYEVSSKYISVYVAANNKLLEKEENDRVVESGNTDSHRVVESRNAENRNAENRNAELAPLSINKGEVINKEEVLIKKEDRGARDFETENKDIHLKQTEKLKKEPKQPTLQLDWKPAANEIITDKDALIQIKDQSGYKDNIREFCKAYFLNLVAKGEWFRLTVPEDPGEKYKWRAKHIAGITSWIIRDKKFYPNRNKRKDDTEKLAPYHKNMFDYSILKD